MSKEMKKELVNHFSEVQELFVALGDEKRQCIIMTLLQQKTCKGLRVPELTDATNLSRPAVSHHLKLLKQANIVSMRSEGTKNFYYLSDNIECELKKLSDLLNNVNELLKQKGERDG